MPCASRFHQQRLSAQDRNAQSPRANAAGRTRRALRVESSFFKADRKPFLRTVHRRDADRDASLLGPELAMLLERGIVVRLELTL